MPTDKQPSKHKQRELWITELMFGTAISQCLKELEFLLKKQELRRLLRGGSQINRIALHSAAGVARKVLNRQVLFPKPRYFDPRLTT
jgi:hypothetical protein